MSAPVPRIVLRDYQQRGFDDCAAAFRRGKRAPVYVAPTGTGKTVLFCAIASSATARGRRVWIVVHRQELLAQTSRALEGLGIEHGLVAPGHTPNPSLAVQVAMVRTLRSRLRKGVMSEPVDLIIFDEGHHAVAGEWRGIQELRPSARILGCTATPERLDGKSLGDVYDEIVLGPSTGEAMADGWLCRARVFAPPSLVDLESIARRGDGEFNADSAAAAMDKPTITGDAVDHYRRVCGGQPAIAFCASVAHAEHVAEQFRAGGFRAESIDGTLSDGVRRQRIADLASGRIHVLTSCDIISEGTDIPVVTCAILLRPTQSLSLYLQQVGRVLRPVWPARCDQSTREARLAAIAASVKPFAVVLDHVGNIKHGLPEEPRQWSLEPKPRASRRGANAEGPALRMSTCPSCYRTHPPGPSCPSCGHRYEVELRKPVEVGGALSEVTQEQAAALRALRREQERREVGRAQTLPELEAIARARGYSPRWAHHVFRARQGRR